MVRVQHVVSPGVGEVDVRVPRPPAGRHLDDLRQGDLDRGVRDDGDVHDPLLVEEAVREARDDVTGRHGDSERPVGVEIPDAHGLVQAEIERRIAGRPRTVGDRGPHGEGVAGAGLAHDEGERRRVRRIES